MCWVVTLVATGYPPMQLLMEINDTTPEFQVKAELFRDFVIELSKLPDPVPVITPETPTGRALLKLVYRAWEMTDKGGSTDEAIANFAATLAVAAADFTVQNRVPCGQLSARRRRRRLCGRRG